LGLTETAGSPKYLPRKIGDPAFLLLDHFKRKWADLLKLAGMHISHLTG
jgi:hypothetical protein